MHRHAPPRLGLCSPLLFGSDLDILRCVSPKTNTNPRLVALSRVVQSSFAVFLYWTRPHALLDILRVRSMRLPSCMHQRLRSC
ncbi:hypothetical protein NL676_035443 [Syzygium grande]|nr:hypothetical protein NL676_035443 [Syzygium grande]